MNLKDKVRVINDFPMPGIRYRDITTLLQDPQAYRELVDRMYEALKDDNVDMVIGPEARGFVLGATLAYLLNAGFVPIRRPGRLPSQVFRYEYQIDQGRSDTLEVHKDALHSGQRVVVVDDLLATGSTALACCEMAKRMGADVVKVCFAMEMTMYSGRDLLEGYDVFSAIKY
ncbi:MAG: adenine phosphoribosyltransferase [Eubacteriales bacterium]|nr:adenine phosphoribosyltransferase [Eubacteriales bacterium]